jgi:hypothetical protein
LAQAPNGVYIHNTNTAINIVGRPVTMSHGLTVGGTLIVNGDVFARRTGSAPTTGYILFGTDNHFIGWDGAQFVGDGARLYRSSDFLIGNAASQVPFSNGVVCVGLNADLLDGAHRGSGANQIPTNDGTLNSQLNACYLHGLLPSNATGQVPISNGVLCTSLNADLVDGYHVGNAANQVPLSNAGLNVNLNAEFLGGQPRTYYEGLAASGVPAGVVAMWKTAVPPGGWVIDADYQNRFPVGAAAAHPLNTNGGVGTHQHDINHGHGAAKATGIANATGTGSTSSSPPPSFSEDTHTHNFLVDATGSLLTAALNHEPPWRGVHFIRKT